MSRPSLLWVTAEPPNRRLGGGSTRQAELVRRLAAVADVDLLVVGDRTEPEVRDAVRSVTEVAEPAPPGRSGGPLQTLHLLGVRRLTAAIAAEQRRSVGLAVRARAIEAGYDAVVVVHEGLADLVPVERDARWFLHLHHVAAERSAQRAVLEPRVRHRVRHRIEARNAARWLGRAMPRWDGVITVSADDARLLGPGAGRVVVAPNGVDLDRFRATPRPAGGPVVLTASLDYPPNVEGARWFVREVWPVVRGRHPGAELQIVGRSPVPEVAALASVSGVSVHPDVPEVPPFLEAAAAVVIPLRIGTGTRLKALEAMAAGRPVVGTSVGIEGLDVRDGGEVLVADDPVDFAAELVRVLDDPGLADDLGRAGRALVEARHGWDRVAADLADALF